MAAAIERVVSDSYFFSFFFDVSPTGNITLGNFFGRQATSMIKTLPKVGVCIASGECP
jgi:hypothetical protein